MRRKIALAVLMIGLLGGCIVSQEASSSITVKGTMTEVRRQLLRPDLDGFTCFMPPEQYSASKTEVCIRPEDVVAIQNRENLGLNYWDCAPCVVIKLKTGT